MGSKRHTARSPHATGARLLAQDDASGQPIQSTVERDQPLPAVRRPGKPPRGRRSIGNCGFACPHKPRRKTRDSIDSALTNILAGPQLRVSRRVARVKNVKVDLSVVIACKNEAARVGTMLASLADQFWDGSWEIVVADNGSTDATRTVVESYASSLPQLLVVDASARPGCAYARNLGVERASGSKIVFVDGDDAVGEGYVAAMAASLDAAELVCARIGFERLNPPWLLDVWSTRWQQDHPLDDFGFLPFAGSGTLGIRRALFEEVGGFALYSGKPSQFEEADLCWRIQLAGHSGPTLVTSAVLHYRLPATLQGLYRRGRNYARGQLVLYDRYQDHGMSQLQQVSFRDLAGSARRIRNKSGLARTAHVLGRLVGQRSQRAVA